MVNSDVDVEGEGFFKKFFVPKMFPSSFQWVPKMFPKFPMCYPRVFPIAPRFNPICFAQSPPLLTCIPWAVFHGDGDTNGQNPLQKEVQSFTMVKNENLSSQPSAKARPNWSTFHLNVVLGLPYANLR